jgi:hypothetical protein
MITGHHFQNAYVTRDIAAAVAQMREHADVRLLLETEVTTRLWTPAGEGEGRQKLAFVWVEDMQYELIEPVSGDVLALYRDALPADNSLKFHHVCNKVDDWDALWARIEKGPFEVVLRGGTPGMLEFCYLDTRPLLGHYLEYVWMQPERWAGMGGLPR